MTISSAAVVGLSNTANAAISLNFVYNTGTDTTVAEYSGTWDVEATESMASVPYHGLFSDGVFAAIGETQGIYWASTPLVGDFPWGDAVPSGYSGDTFGLVTGNGNVFGPSGFTSETVIVGSLIFAGYDLTELGFDAMEIEDGGTIVGDAGTINWSASVIPEPSNYALLLGVTILGVTLKRRRAKRVP